MASKQHSRHSNFCFCCGKAPQDEAETFGTSGNLHISQERQREQQRAERKAKIAPGAMLELALSIVPRNGHLDCEPALGLLLCRTCDSVSLPSLAAFRQLLSESNT